MTRLSLLLLALVGASVAACAAPPPPSSAELADKVSATIGDAACDQSDQCRVIAVGSKPCGGPSGYRAWSTQGSDANALQAAVLAQSTAEQREHAASGMRSTCNIVPVPTASCRPRDSDGKKTCQLDPASLRGLD
ncbi:hypothetical protein SNE35_30350 [Paucibacter sp. R3-3]|uniref:DUF4189 domain-containing protein n=1 Tax=Roseateles agri TaxID=3098619 RepID=A0ABU5DRT9_9BURK|nr:hypothetical protein [Paucibacter sp. R3-3]MDY0748839.1 hypothetical protein [Paucibacter sp. R3-3]